MQRFSQDQSFADPVHSGGSPRVATDAHQDMPPSTSRGSLNLSEEE